jgi:hypothetical protein
MFSQEIVDTDVFLDMPQSTQLLYFHLALRADDDGFVSPKKVMRMIGAANDDLKMLVSKRYILIFESGVVVIKHWLIHNLIRADVYKETTYVEEKALLGLNDFGAYTEKREGVGELRKIEPPKWLKARTKAENGTESVQQRADIGTTSARRLGKDRLGKDRLGQDSEEEEGEKPVAVPATLSPAEEMRIFVSEEGKQHEVMALLVSKGIPEAISEREVRKFLGYWTELNKTGKKQRWELQKTFELRRRLATWFNNIAERQQGSQRPRGINLND